MLKEQESLEDTKNNNQDTEDEELYQRMFKKIARDFVYWEDLELLVDGMYKDIEEAQKKNKKISKKEMRYYTFKSILRALEYKNNLSQPKHKRKEYKDVTDG